MSEKEKLDQTAQVALMERLQTLWLEHMERLLKNGTATSTDLATLYRAMKDNGWTLDPTKLPKELADKLTSVVDPNDFADEETKVFPISKAM